MCGHVGIAGKLEYKDEATLKRLLLLDYFRGTDSTGVAAIRKDGNTPIAKLASHPIDLFDSKAYEKLNTAFQTKVFIGHNRAATKGKVNGNNAHPYQYGHIIGAHNGTLEQSSWKDLNECLGYETDVDSMAIFACIEKVGIEETVKMLRGAWALVWVNLEERTLNFLRNKERPMWHSYTSDFNKIIWASEWPMIQAATEMGGKDAYDLYTTSKGHCFFSMEEDYLYSYDFDKMSAGQYTNLPDAKIKKIEGRPPLPVVTYPQGGSPFTGGAGTTKTTTSGQRTPSEVKTDLPPVITIITSGDKPFGNFLDRGQFDANTDQKCMYCLEPMKYDDEGVVYFEGMEEALCGECSGHSTSRFMATPRTYHEHLKPKENVK